jgi:hypothetical protein
MVELQREHSRFLIDGMFVTITDESETEQDWCGPFWRLFWSYEARVTFERMDDEQRG